MMLVGIVFVISVGSFYLIHLLPGNPATVILGFGATPEAKADPLQAAGSEQADLPAVLRLDRQHPARQPRHLVHLPDPVSSARSARPCRSTSRSSSLSQILAFAAAIPTGDAFGAQARRHPRPRPRRQQFHAAVDPARSSSSSAGALHLDQDGHPPHRSVVLRVLRHRLDHQSREPLVAGLHPGHRQLRRLLPRAAQRPDRHAAGGVHHDGPFQGHQPATHHVAPRLSPVLGRTARRRQRQHRRPARRRLRGPVPACRFRASATR